MLDALRALRLELDALTEAIKSSSGATLTAPAVLQRVEQFFLSWSNLRSTLISAGVPREVVARTDHFVANLVRLIGRRSRRDRYLRTLAQIRGGFGQLLLEIARISASPALPKAPPLAPTALIPEIPGLSNDLLPNSLYGWTDGMRRFLRTNNYDHNVFIMVTYRRRLTPLITAITVALRELGFNAVVARDHRLTDDLYNPLACLLCCRYGVAIFDRGEPGQIHNANIVYELAMMQILKRPCVILKHVSVRSMPSDFLHRLYEPYRTIADAVARLNEWWERTNRANT